MGGGLENRPSRRNTEDGVPVRQEEAANFAAKSTVIAPPQTSTVVDFRDGAAAALNVIRTGECDKDSPDRRKTCNVAGLDVGGGDGSSFMVSNTSKSRNMLNNVAEDADFLSLDVNLSCNDLQLEYVKPVFNNMNGSVMIPSDVVNRGSLPYSRTLCGFFIRDKETLSVIDYHIRKMWKTYGIEDIIVIKGFYVFKFKTNEGMLNALENGPWAISSIPIFLKRWSPGLILDKLKLPVWVKIYDMPLELWNKNGLNIVASILGNPLAVDSCTAKMCMNPTGIVGYARVLVDFEATGNWPDEVSISVANGNGYTLTTLRVEYSWKPPNCSVCKVFDHTDSNCIQQKIMAKVKENQLNETRLKKEEEERENKRRYKAQPHLYTLIKVVRDEDLLEQIGKDIFFDLVDHDKVRCFYVKKQLPFKFFKEEVAKEFGVPVQFQRFWIWAKRQNHTYRPNRPLTAQEETQSVGQVMEVSSKKNNGELKLFLEIGIDPELHPLPPPEKSRDDILLFFKLYDADKEELRYVGRFFVKILGKPIEIISKLNERAGFSPDEEIELFEEIKFEPCVMCERLDKRSSFRSSQIEDGDIICFQKLSQAQAVDKYRYPDVPSFLEYVKSYPDLQCMKSLKVIFHHATKEEPVIHNIRLKKRCNVGDVLNEIKTKLELSHPDAELRLLQLFNHKICKIIPLTEKIDNINDEYWTLRAEEIPEEEKNLGPKNQLIRVYHFFKDVTQNQMQVQNFWEPFLLMIHENETLAAVKVRIQNKLEVPHDEFSKWKFAFVSLGCPQYLQDSDVVSISFQRRGLYENWEQYLGLEHTDIPLKAL